MPSRNSQMAVIQPTRSSLAFTPTHENGAPNTRNGPPTATTHVTAELYRDQNGAVWRCTAGGTPGTWLQVLPAFGAADPASGTFPAGYLVVNVTTGQIKIHAGGLAWKAVHLPVAGGTLDDGANVAVGTGAGTRLGTAATQKLGFWGATPVSATLRGRLGGGNVGERGR